MRREASEKRRFRTLVTTVDDIPGVIEQLCAVYDESVANLRSALARYLTSGEVPDPRDRAEGAFAYPELCIDYRPDAADRVSVARLRPAEPSRPLRDQHRAAAPVPQISDRAARAIWSATMRSRSRSGRSTSEIPYPYVLDGSDDLRLDGRPAPPSWRAAFPTHRAGPYRRRDRRRRLGLSAARPSGRCRCSTGRASISAWRGCATIPARRPSTPSATCCSPTMSAMSTSSSAGRSRS